MEVIYISSLAVAFIGLNIADMMLTRQILRIGGKEANPFVRSIIQKFGFIKATAIKMSIIGIVVFFSIWWQEFATMLILTGIFGAICIWDSFVLVRKEHIPLQD